MDLVLFTVTEAECLLYQNCFDSLIEWKSGQSLAQGSHWQSVWQFEASGIEGKSPKAGQWYMAVDALMLSTLIEAQLPGNDTKAILGGITETQYTGLLTRCADLYEIVQGRDYPGLFGWD